MTSSDDTQNVGGASSPRCVWCDGQGVVEVPHPSGWEEYGTIYGECRRCDGTGLSLGASSDSPGGSS